MKVGKHFSWEMAHRLMYHKGKCYNLHGHSYRAHVLVEGEIGVEGMVIDFADIKKAHSSLIDSMDHAVMCYKKDQILVDLLGKTDFKSLYVDFETTAENIAKWLFDQLRTGGLNVSKLTVWETNTSLVEYEG